MAFDYKKEYKKLYDKELQRAALDVALQVFMEFEAPEYPAEGVEEFKRALNDPNYTDLLTYYAAFEDNTVIGMLATRKQGSHIALFFVNSNYHHQGIGRNLFHLALKDCTSDFMTVFSSPFAVPIYQALGFESTEKEQVDNGIRYFPMRLTKQL